MMCRECSHEIRPLDAAQRWGRRRHAGLKLYAGNTEEHHKARGTLLELLDDVFARDVGLCSYRCLESVLATIRSGRTTGKTWPEWLRP